MFFVIRYFLLLKLFCDMYFIKIEGHFVPVFHCIIHLVFLQAYVFYNFLSAGLPGHPAEPKNGMEGPRGPRGFPGPVGQPGMLGVAGVPGFCEARDCSIHAPVMRKEQGLVKGPVSSKI